MSALNLVLHPGYIYCCECLAQISANFLFCPRCGFVRTGDEWVISPPSSPPLPGVEEQQVLLFPGTPEYLA